MATWSTSSTPMTSTSTHVTAPVWPTTRSCSECRQACGDRSGRGPDAGRSARRTRVSRGGARGHGGSGFVPDAADGEDDLGPLRVALDLGRAAAARAR